MEVLQRTANRGSIATGGYEIDNSLKFEPDNSEILKRTYGSGGTVQKWTFSTWIKRTELVGCRLFGLKTNGNVFLQLSGDKLRWYVNGNDQYTEAVYRDTSAWYHIILQFDSAQATASNRTKIYVNGVQQTLTGSYVGQNTSAIINSAVIHGLGGREDNNTEIFAGYMAETYFIDNQALEPSDFGEYDSDSGIWKPKEYEGTYGTTGWYLDFEDNTSAGKDTSGNNNNFSDTNLNAADHATDTPTNNFATANVIGNTRSGKFTYTEGGTKVVRAGSTDWDSWANTIAVGSGKWYAEFKIIGAGNHFVGVGSEDYYFIGAGNGTGFPEIYYGYSGTNSVGLYSANGNIYNNGTIVVIGTTFTNNDIISVALDTDNGKVYFAKNGTYINSQNPVTGTNAQNLPDTSARYFIGTSHYTSSIGAECNYGGYTSFSISSAASDANGYGTFEYAPPSGYYALCTKNLAEYG